MKQSTMMLVGLSAILIVLGVVGVQKVRHRGDRRAAREEVAVDVLGRGSVPRAPRREYQQAASPDNPGARSVVEASKTGKHPERLSPLIAPPSFDPAAFEANPQSYLGVVEPGRCFQTLKNPGPDSPYLQPASESLVATRPADPVLLMVKGAPNAPVTFTAFEGGQFSENGLNSVSVRGDARGYASVHFKAPKDAKGRLSVLAGSPLAVGNQTFLLDATLRVVRN